MSYRSNKLPPLSTQGSKFKFSIRGPWSMPPSGLRDVQFLQSWLEYDSDENREIPAGQVNWSMLGGLALVAAISASFWTGIGFAVAHALR